MQKQNNADKYIIIYSDRHESYGLFDDLKDNEDVQLVPVKAKKVGKGLKRYIKKVHLSGVIANHIRLPFKSIWYEKPEIRIDDSFRYHIIVVDMVLSSLSVADLKKLFANMLKISCQMNFYQRLNMMQRFSAKMLQKKL